MKGFRVERVWGWDCHGIPIENMIEKELELKGGKKGIEELGIDKFNAACRSAILRFDEEWEKVINRLGRWVDFKNSYKTMDNSYMESVWWAFKSLHERGLVYKGKRVILYCPRCATPLSNFEIAMDNSYKDVHETSTTYKYQVVGEENTYLLAWSTTPWNKLATPALAVNPDLEYVKVKQGDEFYVLAKSRLEMLKDQPYEVLETRKGSELEGMRFKAHYDFFSAEQGKQKFVIVADDFVTDDEGTGIVTLAVYGEDDYRVMQKHNIELVEHVDDQGKLKEEVKPWAGMYILKADPLVNEDLKSRNLVYDERPHTHSVPTCYRCGTRLYYAPVPAWFIDVQKIKPELLEQNEKINWYPDHLKHGRFGKGLETAPDWNISRSRYWGTPMPVWVNQETGKQRILGSFEELKKWAVEPKKVEALSDFHREFVDDLEIWVDDEKTLKGKRIPEVFDCWVESGSMPYASVHYPFENQHKFEQRYPAQFISEYIAQTRAWFYTLHVMSTGLFGKPAFENAVTTGTILAADGSKMSKSKKNYPDPMLVINKYGVDSLRLYLMSSSVMRGENLNFSEVSVDEIRKKVFSIWWNVFVFYQLYADQEKAREFPQQIEHVMDQWLISRFTSLQETVTEHMDKYDVVAASRELMEFVNELSTWYLRLSRERLRDKENNAQASQIFGAVLYQLALLFAPFTPFFSELVYQNMGGKNISVHLEKWPSANTELRNETLEKEMKVAMQLVEQVRAQRKEKNLKLRQPLAKAKFTANIDLQKSVMDMILQEVNVEEAELALSSEKPIGVVLDTMLTPELIEKGKLREVIRTIQDLRKQAGVPFDALVKVQLPDWPQTFELEIKRKTLVEELVRGGEAKILTS